MKEARYKMSHISWFHFCDMSGTDKSIESICRLWELGLEGIGTNWEGLMLKLNLQYFGHLMWRTDSLERPWCWERLKAGGEGDNRGWDGWRASPTQRTWVWASSGSWWWTGKPGVLQSMGSQRVRHDWETELNWIIDSGNNHQMKMLNF